MKYYISIIVIGVLITFPHLLNAQIPTQTIRGQITNVASGSPLPGVTVKIVIMNHSGTGLPAGIMAWN